jgi:glucokinase
MRFKDEKYVIGVDLGGTNVRAAVVDRSGKIIGEGRTGSRAVEGLDATVTQIISAPYLARV